MSVIRKSMVAAAFLAAAGLPGAAMAQGWGCGDRGGYGQDRDDRGGEGYGGYRSDGNRRGGDGYRRGGDGYRRGGDDYRHGVDDYRREGDDYRRGWDGDRRRQGWGGAPHGPGPGGGAHWYNGRWWNLGAGPCWRWSQWRQNWKWVCD